MVTRARNRVTQLFFLSKKKEVGMEKSFVFLSGDAHFLRGDPSRRFWPVGRLGYKPSTTPPVGTPGPFARRGNSAPARTLVAGFGKSERSGERRGQK
jgi:hypothetical protein